MHYILMFLRFYIFLKLEIKQVKTLMYKCLSSVTFQYLYLIIVLSVDIGSLSIKFCLNCGSDGRVGCPIIEVLVVVQIHVTSHTLFHIM